MAIFQPATDGYGSYEPEDACNKPAPEIQWRIMSYHFLIQTTSGDAHMPEILNPVALLQAVSHQKSMKFNFRILSHSLRQFHHQNNDPISGPALIFSK